MPKHLTSKDISTAGDAEAQRPDVAVSERTIDEIQNDMLASLQSKSDSEHQHFMSDIDNLDNELNNKQPHHELLDSVAGMKNTDVGVFASRGKGWFAMKWTQLKFMLGIDNVSNTSDVDKPISTAQAQALLGKSDKGHHHEVSEIDNLMMNYQKRIEPTMTTTDYYSGTKTFQPLNKTTVGLPNVDNTSDINKPVSTAQATAINTKSNIGHGHVIEDVTNLQNQLNNREPVINEGLPGQYFDGTKTFVNLNKTAVYIYDQGVKITAGTPQTGDTIIWHDMVTTSGGNATFYVTSDRTNSGTAICSSLQNGTVDAAIIDSTGATARGDSVVTSNKQIVVPITKQSFTGLVVLGLNVLGAASMPAAPNGITVKLYVTGVKA